VKSFDENRDGWHSLAFQFHRKAWTEGFGAALIFMSGESWRRWEVSGWTKKAGVTSITRTISTVCDKNGVLDRDRMVRSFLALAAKQGFVS
jgi:hypothetical protein